MMLRSSNSMNVFNKLCILVLCIGHSQQLPRPQSEHNINFAVESGAPLITPLQEDIILENNSNYTLRCEGTTPLKWMTTVQSLPSQVPFDTQDPKRPYGNMLYLSEIDYQYVGYYYCILEANFPTEDFVQEETLIDLVNDNKASSIYIYVNDQEHLLVTPAFGLIHAKQYEDVTLPCKPTMPDTEVLLMTQRDETLNSNKVGRYDPKRGFVVQIRGLTDAGDFRCLPKIPSPENEDEEWIIHVQYDGNERIRSLDPKEITTVMITATETDSGRNDSPQLEATVETMAILPTKTPIMTTAPVSIIQNYARSESTPMITQSTVTNQMVFVATNNNQSENNNNNNNNNNNSNSKIDGSIYYNKNKAERNNNLNNNKGNNNGNNIHNIAIVRNNNVGIFVGSNNIDAENFSHVHSAPIISQTLNENDNDDIIENDNTGDDKDDSDDNSDHVFSNEYIDDINIEMITMTSPELHFSTVDSTIHSVSSLLHSTSRTFRKRDLDTTTPSYYRSRSSHFGGGSTTRPKTDYIKKPNITSKAQHHVFEGENFELICSIEAARDVRFKMEWSTPNNDDRILKSQPELNQPRTGAHNIGISNLTVTNAKKSDSGIYKCTVEDHSHNKAHNSYLMTVLSPNENYINISEPNNYYSIRENANKTVTITVNYRGYPTPTLRWYKPDGTPINTSRKYNLTTTDTTSTLQIHKAEMLDSGEYLVKASNTINNEKLQFNVSISDTPIVSLEDVYVQAGDTAQLTCKVFSYPTAIVTWLFKPCDITPRWPTCNQAFQQEFNSSRSARHGEMAIEYLHDLYFTPTQPGIMTCFAVNRIGKKNANAHVLIGDISDRIAVYGIDENKRIARGDEVTITCAALAYYFSSDLDWFKNGEVVEESDDLEIESTASDYSYKKSLKFKSVKDLNQGTYECRARDVNYENQTENKTIQLFVYEPMAPNITSNFESYIKKKLGDSLELECKSDGIPAAEIKWYKDNVPLTPNEHYAIDEEYSKLIIAYMRPDDDGTFQCIASNRLGEDQKSVEVKITDLPGLTLGLSLGLGIFFTVLIALVIYLCIRVRRERKLLRELKAAGLANFEQGAVEYINPALSLDEQADLLPYDPNFEFPRDKLKLGKQLGAGAFGVVLKAYAEGIRPNEKESVVAVKMVKRTADNEVMRALVSELKIMVHLGQHLNVVNLLGAVTKNIAKRELMVIVEFCRFGNLQNFLLRNRKRFIDQIHPETNRIDPTITVQRFSDNFEVNRDGLKYVNLTFSNHQYMNHINNMNNNYSSPDNRRNSDNDPRSGTRAGRPHSRGYVSSDQYDGQLDSCATERTVMTTIPDDETVMSNNSIQPAWRSNYKPDSTEAMTITTSDLVSYAFQVARGMDYLAMRKVVHGDLAARNLLLCEEGVVKICDFGLARSIYKSDTYKKQGEAPLPIKWLALESLSDHVFNTYTDVWSFGIVMWEFFSLAKVPYPGMDPTQSLFIKLKDGYRMEKPPFANDDLYDIMLECWSTNPESRPLFNVLEKRFARMLGDEVTSHYLDLNEPYLRSNSEYMKNNPTDYLSLMGSPEEVAPPPPRYVNGHILPEIRIEHSSDDYLQMSPNAGSMTIFSPTRPKDYELSNDIESDGNHDDDGDDDDDADRRHTDGATAHTTTTSFTFPDTLPQQQYSPTLANNMNSPENKNIRKDGVGIQPEEIPMLHSTHHHHASGSEEDETSPEQGRKFSNILQQMQKVAPTPSPRHHIAETKLSGHVDEAQDDEDGYVNVNSSRTPQKKSLTNNSGERKVDAFSNPSYQMLKTAGNQNTK